MSESEKLHEALDPLTRAGAPLRARLAHLAYGGMLLESLEALPGRRGRRKPITVPKIELALDTPLAAKLKAEIASGKYPLVNANPGFGAAMLIGIVIGDGVLAGVANDGDDEEMVPGLVGAMACQAHLDRYRADLAQYGADDDGRQGG